MRIIFLGSQGSGKSTQAKLLAQKLRLPYIEMGQLFRERIRDNDEEAVKIKKALDGGELVPDEIAVNSLKKRLLNPDCQNGYVLDGYPRNYGQLQGLEPDIDKVFYIKLSDQESLKRSVNRAREDDTPSLVTRRLELYHQKTRPLLAYFRQKRILEEVNGQGPVEAVEKEITQRIKNARIK